MESTIDGVYSTNASRTPAMSFNAPSAIAGTHSTSTSTSIRTTALTASPMAPALSAITLQNSTIASPILATIAGIRAATPVMITVKEATMAVAPAVPAAARAVKPTAKADKPAPARASPAPIPTTATPISASEPLKARMEGTNGANTAPATPRIANAPARVTRPFTMELQLMAPRIDSTGVSTKRALAATRSAAEPARVPVMAFRPIARMAIAPPRVIRPLAISSQDIEPIWLRALASISKAAETAIRPVPMPIMFFGMKLTAIVTAAKAPAIATRPLAISSHCIPEKSFTADANIFMAAPIAMSATPVEITCLALPVSLVKAVTSARSTAIDASPLPMSSHFISPKSLQAEANTLIAAERITIPVAVVMDLPLNFAVLRNRETSASNTPTPTRPFTSWFQSNLASCSQTEARILIAAAKITI